MPKVHVTLWKSYGRRGTQHSPYTLLVGGLQVWRLIYALKWHNEKDEGAFAFQNMVTSIICFPKRKRTPVIRAYRRWSTVSWDLPVTDNHKSALDPDYLICISTYIFPFQRIYFIFDAFLICISTHLFSFRRIFNLHFDAFIFFSTYIFSFRRIYFLFDAFLFAFRRIYFLFDVNSFFSTHLFYFRRK